MSIGEESLQMHKTHHGKITLGLAVPLETREDLSRAYTPGVGTVASYLSTHPSETNHYTWRGRCVAVISDGSAVLGLGNIGPEGAYPVMEGKCALFKRFANLDAVPIVLSTQDSDEIIATIQSIAPSFGAINLEDIAAPKCFYIEEKLRNTLSIPVIHDDQWGTAVVVFAALLNALKVVDKRIDNSKIVINGAGAAGTAVARILHHAGVQNLLVCDSKGIISSRSDQLTEDKKRIARISNPQHIMGDLKAAVHDADVLIGLSRAGLFTKEMIRTMKPKPVVCALANPTPEIMPEEAREAGAAVVATGRSDFANQVNNALAFPGIFHGLLLHKKREIDIQMLVSAAKAIAGLIEEPDASHIIPSVFDTRLVPAISNSMK